MSLDIHLFEQPTSKEAAENPVEVASMNWLRNPYGLCNWAEDNFDAVGAKSDTKLWYVVNNWNYDKSADVDRELFKSVVDGYWKVIQKLDKGYFFFNVYSYIQFVEPHRAKFPTEFIKIIGEERIKGLCHALPDRIGLPMHYFTKDIIDLGANSTRHEGERPDPEAEYLAHYKDWFYQLVQFAEKLQNKKLVFYCSN